MPVPANAVAVRPLGSASVIVIALLVAAVPELVTVIVYVAPVWPCVKLPVCAFAIVRSGPPTIVATSVAVSLVVLLSPPPETVAVLVTLAGALAATADRQGQRRGARTGGDRLVARARESGETGARPARAGERRGREATGQRVGDGDRAARAHAPTFLTVIV